MLMHEETCVIPIFERRGDVVNVVSTITGSNVHDFRQRHVTKLPSLQTPFAIKAVGRCLQELCIIADFS